MADVNCTDIENSETCRPLDGSLATGWIEQRAHRARTALCEGHTTPPNGTHWKSRRSSCYHGAFEKLDIGVVIKIVEKVRKPVEDDS